MKTKAGIRVPRPPQGDPDRISAQDPGPGVTNCGMATLLGAKIGVPRPSQHTPAGQIKKVSGIELQNPFRLLDSDY